MEKRERKSTKKDLMIAALKLFAEKGYEAVSVAQIANAVGVSAPAIYKHYASKQDLFEAILKDSEEGHAMQMRRLNADFSQRSAEADKLVAMTPKEHAELVCGVFQHTLHDEFPSAFRKLLAVEQFHMPQLAEIYNKRYVDAPIAEYKALFELLIRRGVMKQYDPYTLAVQYSAPINLMITACDRDPSREEEALKIIENHVIQFNRIYRAEPFA